MKNILPLLFLFSLFISCEKENGLSNPETNGCLLIKSFKNSVLLEEYLYNELNHLKEVRRYQGGNYVFETLNLFYTDSKIKKLEFNTEFNSQILCSSRVFEYNEEGNLFKVFSYNTNELECEESTLTSTTEYFYSNSSILDSSILLSTNQLDTIGYNKRINIYDSNSNLEISNCYIDSLFISTIHYEFDDQINPLLNYFGNGMNNILKRVSQRLDIPVQPSETDYSYEYNEQGYPKKRTLVYGNGLEEFLEYEYLCD